MAAPQFNIRYGNESQSSKPEAMGASAVAQDTDLAVGAPTYVCGTSTSGTYADTQSSNGIYQVSTASFPSPTTVTETATAEQLTQGHSVSGTYLDCFWSSSNDSFAAELDGNPLIIDVNYTFQFTEDLAAHVSSLVWKLKATVAAYESVPTEIYIFNYTKNDWDDTGQSIPVNSPTWNNYVTSVDPASYMDASGNMKLRIYSNGPQYTQYLYVNYVAWVVEYGYYKIDYSYLFHFGGTMNTIVSLSWTAKGKTSSPAAPIYLFNCITASWDAVGYSFNATDVSYSGFCSYTNYVNSTGYMGMRFSLAGQTSSFTVSADYLAFTVTYHLTGAPVYSSLLATSDPIITNGTLGGGYWQTWTQNSSYQVVTAGGGATGNPALYAGTAASVSYGTIPWTNPTYAQGAPNGQSATAAFGKASANSYWLQATNFGFTVPDGNVIDGIVCVWRKSMTTSGTSYIVDLSVQIMKAGTPGGTDHKDASTHWPSSLTYVTYGTSSDLWGLSWAPADVRASNFGCALAATGYYAADNFVYTGNLDSCQITVYYHLAYAVDYYYAFRFVDGLQSDVQQLGWFINGKTSSPSVLVYLYSWSSASWVSTGLSLTSTQASISQQSVDVNTYMATNGSVRVRIYLSGQTSGFSVSVDLIRIDLIYAPLADVTPPTTPNLFYPSDGSTIGFTTTFVWNESHDDISGVAYYRLAISNVSNFATTLVNTTLQRTWYVFDHQHDGRFYWKLRAVDVSGNVGSYSGVWQFDITQDPVVYIVYRNANNPSLNEIMSPAAFNTTYHRSSQDAAGAWNTLNPYTPSLTMFSTEYVNITVRDWLGNYLINNQQYSYSPTIVLNLNVYDVCVGNGADAMAYIILKSGTTILHKFTYRSDIHWLVIGGNYNLTVIYPSVGNIQVYYNLTITGDYGIKVSSNTTADLYSASMNWDLLTTNVAGIVATVQGVRTEVYNVGMTQAQMQTMIQGVSSDISDIGSTITTPGGIIADPWAALKLLVASIGTPAALAIIVAIVRHLGLARNVADARYKRHVREENEGKGSNYPSRENVSTSRYVHDEKRR